MHPGRSRRARRRCTPRSLAWGVPVRYILLPTRGFLAHSPTTAPRTREFLLRAQQAVRLFPGVRVLDSIRPAGAKLVEAEPAALTELRRAQPGLRIVPEVFLQPAIAARPHVEGPPSASKARRRAAARPASFDVTVTVAGPDGGPVGGADVIAFTDYERREGATGRTRRNGRVALRLDGEAIERLYVYPADSAWPIALAQPGPSPLAVELAPIDLAFADSRARCLPPGRRPGGRGVVVGLVDSGVGPHGGVQVAGGLNAVTGEDPDDFSDSGEHGTHVAGIIAGNAPPFRGGAAAATLRAYRVFGKGARGASNFAIAKAIDAAVSDGCDLINLSLGGGAEDELIGEAVKSAREAGVVCVVAAGNDGGPVSWPGRHRLAVCVSAIGVLGAWPETAPQRYDAARPRGKRRTTFAAFSNRGPQVALVGPGLGIISTVPHDRYAVMDGTSMACPAVTAAIATRLARSRRVLLAPRDAERSDAIIELAFRAAVDLGMPADFQGVGLAN